MEDSVAERQARMASANSNQNVNDKLVIFKGDDTGGVFGRRLQFAIEVAEGADLTGCRAEWIFDGIVKAIDAPLTAGETREIFYSHNETEQMLLGVRYGTFRIIDAAGKRATMTNTRAVEVTDNVARCYPGASAATVRIGTFISWENISGKPILVKTVNGEAPDASGNINIEIEEPVLDDTVTEKSPNGVKSSGIWSWVKSLLPNWLTSDYAEPATVESVANKRDKVDLSVYSVTKTENTDWTWTSENAELAAALNEKRTKIHNDNMMWIIYEDPSPHWSYTPAQGNEDDLSVVMYFAHDEDLSNLIPATATRPRYMDESIGPAKQNQQIAAVATDDAAKPADGSLMKYDAANYRLVKAVEGTDYLKTHQDISGKRDHGDFEVANEEKTVKFGEWKFTGRDVQPGAVYSLRFTESELMDQWDLLEDGNLIDSAVYDKSVAKSVTEISPADWFNHSEITATRPRFVYVDGPDTLVGAKYVDGKVSSAVSTNNPAFVSAVQNTPAPEPGQGEDPPWGTWGTVGAAIAGLVAGLKWLKDKVFDSAGNIQDQFATDLLGKPVAKEAIIYKANTATGLKDRAFNALSLDGTEYNLSNALAAVTTTVENQPRDLLIVATATASTTISFTAGTIKGDKPTIDGAGTWLITLTEYAANTWYCRQIKMEDAA